MVKRRNRKLETGIDVALTNPTTGVHYFQTTLSNSFGYGDGYASSVWPMGTKINFHNTGTSTGGDFGELNKLNYDNAIELFTPDTWLFDSSGSYLSASNPVTGSGSGKNTDCGTSQDIGWSYTNGEPIAKGGLTVVSGWGNATVFTGNADQPNQYLPENYEGVLEFQFSSSDAPVPSQHYPTAACMVSLVPSGSNYLGSPDLYGGAMKITASVGWKIGDDGTSIMFRDGTADKGLSKYRAWFARTGDQNFTNLELVDYGPTTIDIHKTKFRIVRKRDKNLSDETVKQWMWQWQAKFPDLPGSTPTENCWQTVGSITYDDIWTGKEGDFNWNSGSASLMMTASHYAVIDFWNSSPLVGLTCSVNSASLKALQFESWNRSQYTANPTASALYCYPGGFITNDSPPYNGGNTSSLMCYKDYGLLWRVPESRASVIGEARYPFFNSYEDYSSDIRFIGKDFSILPEFKISKQVDAAFDDEVLRANGQGREPSELNFGYLSLDGASITSSGEGFYNGVRWAAGVGTDFDFYKSYSNSDFQSELDLLTDQHTDSTRRPGARFKEFTITCEALLKLLPYEGFYPITRTAQLANYFSRSVDFSSSVEGYNAELSYYNEIDECWTEVEQTSSTNRNYDGEPRLHGIRTQGITMPFFGPGILYNSVKSGVGLGWTIVTSSHLSNTYQMWDTTAPHPAQSPWDKTSVLKHRFLNTCLYKDSGSATKIPFEALYRLDRFPRWTGNITAPVASGSYHITYPEACQGFFTSSICLTSSLYTPQDNFMVRLRNEPQSYGDQYEMAMGNFLAETVRFFLRDRRGVDARNVPDAQGQLCSLRSMDARTIKGSAPGQGPIVGATYHMDVVMKKTPSSFFMVESYWNERNKYWNQMAASQSAMQWNLGVPNVVKDRTIYNFSASFNGRYFGPATQKYLGGYWNEMDPVSGAHYNVCDPAQAPYTPPYFYGDSRVTLEYTAGDEWNDLTQDPFTVMFSKIKTKFANSELERKIQEGNLNRILGKNSDLSFAYKMAQNVGDSMNLLGKLNQPRQYNLRTETSRTPQLEVGGARYTSEYDPDSTRWVISTKWECPVLNFGASTTDTLYVSGGLHPTCSVSQSHGFLDNQPVGVGRGMWSTYGTDAARKGINIELTETPGIGSTSPHPTQPGTFYNPSLLELLKFRQGSGGSVRRSIGKLANKRSISEAVVAIPYTSTPVSSPNSRYVLTTDDTHSYWEIFGDGLGKQPARYFLRFPVSEIFGQGMRPMPRAGHSEDYIADLSENMRKFILPPQFDFLKIADPSRTPPIAMYIFPFDVVLNKTDLQDIWQGVLPNIGVTAEKRTIDNGQAGIIQHDAVGGFFQGKMLPPDVKWMVFKVKQKGTGYYEDVTKNSGDDRLTQMEERLIQLGGIDPREYTYNWPYDFCSLVELGKVQTSFTFDVPPTPPPPGQPPLPPVTPPQTQASIERDHHAFGENPPGTGEEGS